MDLTKATFRRVSRSVPAANGQVRVWVEVEPGEEIMLKLPEGADVQAAVRDHLTAMRAAAETERLALVPTLSVEIVRAGDAADEVARIDAEIERLAARRAGLLSRVR